MFFEPVRRRKLVYYVMLKATATAPRVLTPWTLKFLKVFTHFNTCMILAKTSTANCRSPSHLARIFPSEKRTDGGGGGGRCVPRLKPRRVSVSSSCGCWQCGWPRAGQLRPVLQQNRACRLRLGVLYVHSLIVFPFFALCYKKIPFPGANRQRQP